MHSGHSACSSSPLLLFITFMMTPEDDTCVESSPSLNFASRTTLTTFFVMLCLFAAQANAKCTRRRRPFGGIPHLTTQSLALRHAQMVITCDTHLDGRLHYWNPDRTHFSRDRHFDFPSVLPFFSGASLRLILLGFFSLLTARSPPVPVGLLPNSAQPQFKPRLICATSASTGIRVSVAEGRLLHTGDVPQANFKLPSCCTQLRARSEAGDFFSTRV